MVERKNMIFGGIILVMAVVIMIAISSLILGSFFNTDAFQCDLIPAAANETFLTEQTQTLLASPVSSSATINEFTWLNFDGEGDAVVNDAITLNFSEGFSVSAWVNLANMGGTSAKPIIEFRNLSSTTPLFNLVARNNTGVARFYFRELVNSSGCDTVAENDTLGNAIFNEWYYLVGNYNADSNNVTLYLNGELQDTGGVTSQCKILLAETETTVKRLGVGGRQGGVDFFDGGIDEVRIYNQTLTQVKITEIFNSGRIQNSSLPDQGLIVWYSFNEGQDSIAHDLSGNNNNGI